MCSANFNGCVTKLLINQLQKTLKLALKSATNLSYLFFSQPFCNTF